MSQLISMVDPQGMWLTPLGSFTSLPYSNRGWRPVGLFLHAQPVAVSRRLFPDMALPFPAGNQLFNANSDGVRRSTGNRKHQRDGKARSGLGEAPYASDLAGSTLPHLSSPPVPWFQGMLLICLPFWSHTNPVWSHSLPTISSGQHCLTGSISLVVRRRGQNPQPRQVSTAGMRHSLNPLAALR